MTWEPREHLACPGSSRRSRTRRRGGSSSAAAAAGGGEGGGGRAAAAAGGAAGNGAGDASAEPARKRPRPADNTAAPPFAKVLRACKPQEGKPLIFEVELHDRTTALVPGDNCGGTRPAARQLLRDKDGLSGRVIRGAQRKRDRRRTGREREAGLWRRQADAGEESRGAV